jgi:hypothetical protein
MNCTKFKPPINNLPSAAFEEEQTTLAVQFILLQFLQQVCFSEQNGGSYQGDQRQDQVKHGHRLRLLNA